MSSQQGLLSGQGRGFPLSSSTPLSPLPLHPGIPQPYPPRTHSPREGVLDQGPLQAKALGRSALTPRLPSRSAARRPNTPGWRRRPWRKGSVPAGVEPRRGPRGHPGHTAVKVTAGRPSPRCPLTIRATFGARGGKVAASPDTAAPADGTRRRRRERARRRSARYMVLLYVGGKLSPGHAPLVDVRARPRSYPIKRLVLPM